MDTIQVLKENLIEVLKTNKVGHRSAFEKALEGWHITVVSELEKMLCDAKENKDRQFYANWPRPEDHTDEYDRHIQMLEMDINDTVELDMQEFAQFVQDDWGWKRQWNTSNFGYISTATSK